MLVKCRSERSMCMLETNCVVALEFLCPLDFGFPVDCVVSRQNCRVRGMQLTVSEVGLELSCRLKFRFDFMIHLQFTM